MWKEFDLMAVKHGRGEIDWHLVVEKVLNKTTPEELAKTMIDKIGMDGLMAILSDEQRRELAERIKAGKK